MDKSVLFTPGKIGPLTLRSRTIRAVAFENMCPGDAPSGQLFNYHISVTAGGAGMTNIAYAAVTQNGLSFERQLWMRPDIIPGLCKLTNAIHEEGTAASIRLSHCGNMSHKRICGCTPISAPSGLNLYSPTIVRSMRQSEIASMAYAYDEAVRLVREAGMDAVEIRVGHGYLISQFLSPYANHRRDEYGGSFESRMCFMRICTKEMVKAADSDMAITVKADTRDGFKGGLEIDERLEVTCTLQDRCGAHALVLSGGSVSRALVYVMRGGMPICTMTYYMSRGYLPIEVRTVGKYMIPSEPFKEAYFLENALKFHKTLHLPLIYVGGLVSEDKIEEILNDRFEFMAMTCALMNEPGSVNCVEEDEHTRCDYEHSNYYVARMYSKNMVCHRNMRGLPECIVYEIKKLGYK